jgi:hypothetical protein
MTSARVPRIWFHPAKYWMATQRMFPEEAERLMNRVLALAENGELNALREFDFISIEPTDEDEAA